MSLKRRILTVHAPQHLWDEIFKMVTCTRSSSPPPPTSTSCRLGLGERSLKYCLTEISWYNKNTINNEFPRWYRFEKNSACPTIKTQGWSHWGGCSFPQRAAPQSTRETSPCKGQDRLWRRQRWCGPEQRSGGRFAEPARQPAQAEQAYTSLPAEQVPPAPWSGFSWAV